MTAAPDFWSRRRAAVAAETQADRAVDQDADNAERRAGFESMPDVEVLEALDLPNPDDLAPGDDFSAFMMREVPERIRRRALRALWRTNPLLANVDGLVDYGGDFTDRATVVENLQTAYQVGKGMLSHLEKMAEDANEVANGVADAEMDAVEAEVANHTLPDGIPDDFADCDMDDIASPQTPPLIYGQDADMQSETAPTPVPRRMVFVFDGDTT